MRLRCGQCFANVLHAMCDAATVRAPPAHSHPAFGNDITGRALVPMIRPFAQDEVFLADLTRPETQAGELRVWWLGQSGFLVRHGGDFLLLDPYLSDSLTRKYAQTENRTSADRPRHRTGKTHRNPVVTSRTITPIISMPKRCCHPRAIQMRLVIPEANRAFVAERLQSAPRSRSVPTMARARKSPVDLPRHRRAR
jgi:hypothetical protein